MLCAAEIAWNGKFGAEGEYQRAINRKARSAPGAFRSDSGAVAAEGSFALSRALLDHHQARSTQRLYAKPRDAQVPEEILTWEIATRCAP